MANLTNDLRVQFLGNSTFRLEQGLPGYAQYYRGQTLMLGSDTGLVSPVTSSTGLAALARCVGISKENFNYTANSNPPWGANGYFSFQVGIVNRNNAVVGPCSEKNVGQTVFAPDDNSASTVCVAGTNPPLGRLDYYDPVAGPFVLIDPTLTLVSGSN